MVEFNPDGSIKLPGIVAQKQAENNVKFQNGRCLKIKKDVVSFDSPKKCALHLFLSQRVDDDLFVTTIMNYYKENMQTPFSYTKVNDREFEIIIGTNFRRCNDCNSLCNRFREYIDGNLILEKGNCTHESKRNFSYEDYFD